MLSILPAPLQPLSRRVPLMVAAVLVAVVVSTVWIAAARLQRAVVTQEMARLHAGARRISAMVEPSVRRVSREGERLVSIPALRDLAAGAPVSKEAQSYLDAELRRSSQTVAMAIWNGERIVAASGPLSYVIADTPQLIRRDGFRATAASHLGRFRKVRDTVLFATITPVMGDSNAAPLGAIVAVRRLISGNEAALYAQLIGRGAVVRIGNADGTLWSDFTRSATGPSSPVAADSQLTFDDPQTGRHLAGVASVPSSPWATLVAIEAATAMEPVRAFVRDIGWIAALLVLGGLGLTWFTVRRSMQPIESVAAAAEGIASGDFGRRVPVTTQDEAGRLATSFNAMADKVGTARAELEGRAAALLAANKEIHESEAKYHGLVDHSPDGILIHQDGRILFANPAAARLLGVNEPERPVGRSFLDFVPLSEQPLLRECNRTVQTGEQGPPLELHVLRDDMRAITVECLGIPIVMNEKPAVQAILRDITERRQLEEQFQQSQKMDAVGRLAGGIAHDFNNLLTVIDSYSEFVMHDLERGDPRRDDIAEVRRAAATAAQLTRQLLAFSRKQGRSPLPLRLEETIRGMVAMLKRLIGENIRLTTELRDGVPAIWADASQLQQVLLNLAINARDAMPSGGELRIETSCVTVSGGPGSAAAGVIEPGTYAMLLVQDNGLGMAPEVRARIFEPFFTTKQPGRGTGLGLSTVYGIVNQAQGHLWVDSAPGRGTTFKIYFPAFAGAEEPAAEEPAVVRMRPSKAARILVVEDDPSVRQAVNRTLTRASLTVVEAGDGREALEVLERDRDVDLVITDMMMPGISGGDLAVTISVRWPGLPIIIMSGYAEETVGQRTRIPDRVTFVEKPIAPGELVDVVQRMLNPQATD